MMDLLDSVTSRRCILCGKPIQANRGELPQEQTYGIHGIHGIPDIPAVRICDACRVTAPAYGKVEKLSCGAEVAAPLKYEGTARRAMIDFKFKGRIRYAKSFGLLASDCVRRRYGTEFDIIVFVPLSIGRRLKRGYNQAKLIARAISGALDGVPVYAALRKRPRKANSALSGSERAKNVSGAYILKRRARVAGKRILLTDDVLTTGATLTECVMELRRGGAADVKCVTVCRTVDKKQRNLNG